MKATRSLERLQLPVPGAAAVASGGGFPDGAHFRVEIPSVEGPLVLAEVIASAKVEGITVNRVSQGSGAMLLREDELREMSALGAAAGIEVSLFVGPREGFDVGVHARSPTAQPTSASCVGLADSPSRSRTWHAHASRGSAAS